MFTRADTLIQLALFSVKQLVFRQTLSTYLCHRQDRGIPTTVAAGRQAAT